MISDTVCKYAEEIAEWKDNGIPKIWFQNYARLANSEDAMLTGLQSSPVAFISLISTKLMSYSGGKSKLYVFAIGQLRVDII